MFAFNIRYGMAEEFGYLRKILEENLDFLEGSHDDILLPGDRSNLNLTGPYLRENLVVSDQKGLCRLVQAGMNAIAPTLYTFFDSHFPEHPSLRFQVQLTRYGTGGEAVYPGTIYANIFKMFPALGKIDLPYSQVRQRSLDDLGEFAPWVVVHEMVHLYIDGDLKAAGLDAPEMRPQREWLVDTIMMCDQLQAICPGDWTQDDSISPPQGLACIRWKKEPTWA
ncbi:MAG: hypothetical protein ACM31D_20655 [Bacteroidota bacterium]